MIEQISARQLQSLRDAATNANAQLERLVGEWQTRLEAAAASGGAAGVAGTGGAKAVPAPPGTAQAMQTAVEAFQRLRRIQQQAIAEARGGTGRRRDLDRRRPRRPRAHCDRAVARARRGRVRAPGAARPDRGALVGSHREVRGVRTGPAWRRHRRGAGAPPHPSSASSSRARSRSARSRSRWPATTRRRTRGRACARVGCPRDHHDRAGHHDPAARDHTHDVRDEHRTADHRAACDGTDPDHHTDHPAAGGHAGTAAVAEPAAGHGAAQPGDPRQHLPTRPGDLLTQAGRLRRRAAGAERVVGDAARALRP